MTPKEIAAGLSEAMPTPEWVKAASREKRKRTCVICGAIFFVRSADRAGLTCSKECYRKRMSDNMVGKKQSDETKAKRSRSLREKWEADPEGKARRVASGKAGLRRWFSNPDNAEAFAHRSSERMKRRHADPEWQKVRDERSSRTLRAVWEKHRDALIAASIDRYARGKGVNSEEGKRNKAIAGKWIMTKAQEALHAETDYDRIYAETQAALRQLFPYGGPENGGDYMDYLQWLGREVVNSPECRTLADSFMSKAIPRFAAEWRARKLPRDSGSDRNGEDALAAECGASQSGRAKTRHRQNS